MPPRPEPENIVQSMNYLMDGLDELRSIVGELRRVQGEELLFATEAMQELGYQKKYAHGKPWRYPNYLSDRPHTLAAWRAWFKKPEAERRAGWDALSPAARRKLLGMEARNE